MRIFGCNRLKGAGTRGGLTKRLQSEGQRYPDLVALAMLTPGDPTGSPQCPEVDRSASESGDNTMNVISVLLTLVAIFSSVVGIGFLVLWLRGIESILLPGLGIVVATPVIVLLILILEVALVLLAVFTKSANVSA